MEWLHLSSTARWRSRTLPRRARELRWSGERDVSDCHAETLAQPVSGVNQNWSYESNLRRFESTKHVYT
jgi:hypothetical protein